MGNGKQGSSDRYPRSVSYQLLSLKRLSYSTNLLFEGLPPWFEIPYFDYLCATKKQAMKKLIFASVFSIIGLLSNSQTTFRESYDVGSFDLSGGMVQNPA